MSLHCELSDLRERMPEVRMPAVLNDTPSTGASRLSWPDSRSTNAASGSGHLSCSTPG
jgi:hypothetical protein